MRTQIRHLTCLLLGLLGFKALPAQALDMYLCIEGVPGEVTAAQSVAHDGCIDVIAWSWGMSNSNSALGGGGQANFQDISITKWIDRASPVLGLRVAGSKTIGPMQLYVENACGADCNDPYYRIEVEGSSYVTSQSQGGSSGGESRLTENISISIPDVKWCYSYDPDGAGGKIAPTDVCESWIITGSP